uniref:Uncharacterized protein n=1 Tax=Anguilla anguilla TaxID=7936 RepID=A0A0E9TCR3_ANGAN
MRASAGRSAYCGEVEERQETRYRGYGSLNNPATH